MAKKRKPVKPMTEAEFVRDCLTHINRTAGVIEYTAPDGNNYEDGFNEDPWEGIRAAIRSEHAKAAEDAGATPKEIDAIMNPPLKGLHGQNERSE